MDVKWIFKNVKWMIFNNGFTCSYNLISVFLASLTLCSYIFYMNMSSLEADTDAMTKVCRTKEEVQVALGYFEKVLERNKLVRRLVGEGMEYYVQDSGEPEPLFYQVEDFSSLAARIYFLNHLLEKL